MKLLVFQGAIQWTAAEVLARLMLGLDATPAEVAARLTACGLRVAHPIEVRHDTGEIVVRLPAEQPPRPELLEQRMRTAEARVAELERQLRETQLARQLAEGRAERAERQCVRQARMLDESRPGWREDDHREVMPFGPEIARAS